MATVLLAIFCRPTFSQSSGQCPSGMVHHFGLDETAAGTYKDYVSPVAAACTDCPAPTNSLFAGGQKFDGANDGLTISDVENFEWGHYDSFTIELWVQVSGSSSNNRVIMGRNAKESGMSWWIGVDPEGYAVFELYDMKRTGFRIEKMGRKLNDGKWHHLVVMRHGTHLRNRLYIDGYKAAEFRYEYQDNFFSAAPVTIGYHQLDNGYHFSGSLDEVIVYNRALEENEVRARYGEGASVYCGPENIPPVITSAPITFGVAGQPYLYDVQAIGAPAPVYSLVNSPPGMQINASTGEITWTPAGAGTYSVTVKAANSQGQVQQSFEITVKKGIGESAGMVHHWMLHEITGTRYRDYYTPYDAVCEPAAKPTPVAGVVSGGQRFDGKSTGLDVSNSSNFNWRPDESFSIELWTRTEASTAGNRVMIGRDGADSDMHWWIGADDSGRAGFMLLDILWQGIYVGESGPRITDGKWHQVVAVRDAGTGVNRLYVDGEKVAEGRHIYENSFASQSPVNIGYLNRAGGYRFEGDLDEVKLFGRALSDAEIRQRYRTTFDAIVELVRFEGRYMNNVVLLEWETQTELELAEFVVERSEDGLEFSEIGAVPASGTSSTALTYNFTDQEPLEGVGFYRLRIVKESGATNYSNIIQVAYGGLSSSSFFVYPNPIQHGEVKVEVTNLKPDERVNFMLSSLNGRKLMAEEVQVGADGRLLFSVNVPDNMSAGIYVLTVIASTKTLSRKLVVAD
ncbi:MAG: putative Ig domain-containing protein [Hymenobacteraceae bacterium]|nr:putative Ig domain-containing protein [Hymenobacteraceae bacterium]